MICQKCGKEIEEGALFCPYCGSGQSVGPVGQMNQAPQAAPTMQPRTFQAQGGQTQTQNPYARPANAMGPQATRAQVGPVQNPYATSSQAGKSQAFGSNGLNNPRPAGGAAQAPDAAVITVGQFILMFIVAGIPIVGLVMLIIWGFVKKDNPTRANFAKATLIMMLIGIVFSILFMSVIVPFIAQVFTNY